MKTVNKTVAEVRQETFSKVPTVHDLTKDLERPASYAVIAIDETSHWHEDIQSKAKKILGVYFVNLREPTNLCDPQINYPATFLYNVFEDIASEEIKEVLFESEFDNGGEDFRYIHEHTPLEESHPYYMPETWFEEMKAEGENWEESQIEYFTCNHVI